jgi:hypothetical protein
MGVTNLPATQFTVRYQKKGYAANKEEQQKRSYTVPVET